MPKIGKNALDSLTRGMYTDAMIIYREYIQNAVDQIDKATMNNSFPGETFDIEIKIDKDNRKITIEDNASGIPKADVKRRLEDVADSDKVQGEERGFRGIGRLGGLAYCRELRYVTSYAGESEQTIMIWDADRLMQVINDPTNHIDADKLLEQIISYEYEPCEKSAHFFRVELIGVKNSNLRNNNSSEKNEGEALLDETKVRNYIAEVAPIEYAETFYTLSHKIYSFLDDRRARATAPPHGREFTLHRYDIYINGEQVYRPYKTYIGKGDESNQDEIKDIHADVIKSHDGEVLAWIWFGISCFKASIRGKGYSLEGLRLRQFNIEIGDEHTLDKFFNEQRGNGYFVGEVHAVSRGLIPNSRRDYFVANDTLVEFEEALTDYAKQILSPLYRKGSDINSAYNRIKKLDELQAAYAQKQTQGFTNEKEKLKLGNELEAAKESAQSAEKKIRNLIDKARDSQGSPFSKMVELVRREHEDQSQSKSRSEQKAERQTRQGAEQNSEEKPKKKKTKLLTDELSHLKKDERKLVGLIYGIIKDNLPEEQSEALIQLIQAELKQKK